VPDEISDLRLFARIVSAGSLSETARRLNSSLPAVSRRLAAMESRLGARLIDRGSRHFSLTEEGNLLFERAAAILADLDQIEAEVGARSATPQGHLRVGAPLEIGRRRFAPLIAEFSRRYPLVTVELVLTDAFLDVVGDDLDVGLHIDVPLDGSVIARRLISSRRVACASPAYIAKHGVPARPEDLRAHSCIRLVRGRHVFDNWTFVDDKQTLGVRVRGALLTNNAEVLHGWILDGYGLGLKALWDIEDDLEAGRLVEVLAPFAHDTINLHLIYPTRSHLPGRVRVFIDFIVEAVDALQRPATT
jgi:DNA-binding transcriptional LysR family regulator